MADAEDDVVVGGVVEGCEVVGADVGAGDDVGTDVAVGAVELDAGVPATHNTSPMLSFTQFGSFLATFGLRAMNSSGQATLLAVAMLQQLSPETTV